ncbi:hypothetical protein M9H77_10671 [Catharanthus roseus]|uniref:Uncharacterized protein n=1 Tax=Catharanthus roseus TaxID=4058 RepID=A0ACC0BCD6_CATRO|nr:hypothetical protein M9H77_10671 [Catharanthus roseus]
MYRSASTNRVTDDHYSSATSASSKVSAALRALSLEANELPVYEPLSETAKKERSRLKFAENAVHLIPVVLLLCAFILWFFCNPDIDVPTTIGSTRGARVEGFTIEATDVDSDGTQTGNLPLELGDLDLTKQDQQHKNSFLGNKSP